MARSFEDIMDYIFFNFYTRDQNYCINNSAFPPEAPVRNRNVNLDFYLLAINYFFALYKLTRYDLPKAAADTKVTANLSDTFLNSANVKLFAALPFETAEFKKSHWTGLKKQKSLVCSSTCRAYSRLFNGCDRICNYVLRREIMAR